MFNSELKFGTIFNLCCIGAGALMVSMAYLHKLALI